ncbi:hypothetical protein [Moorena producens]|uniref:hypothetical protein n=1 Tax=Moorena producens TaxID=1155739 RepID=UPI003C7269CA
MNLGLWPRVRVQPNNLGLWPRVREQPNNLQPWPIGHGCAFNQTTLAFGHATRTTFNLGLWPRYANNQTTLAFGHATRTTKQPWPLATLREQPNNLGLWPRYANNLQPYGL